MPSFSYSYEYDGAGNRTKMTNAVTGEITTYTYDAANQLTKEEDASGVTTYTYDPRGNRTKKETPTTQTDYTWDAQNRLTVVEPVGSTVSYTYNAAGQRVKKETASETKKFLYDFNDLLAETDENDATQNLYTQTTEEYGNLISAYDGSASSYPMYDAEWSTAALIDDNESVTDRYRYRAFGEALHTTGSSTQPHTFVGKKGYYRDEDIDFYFVRARYYDPAAARWVSRDPLGLGGGDENLYRYVKNNPVNKIDPSGKQDESNDDQLLEALKAIQELLTEIGEARGKVKKRMRIVDQEQRRILKFLEQNKPLLSHRIAARRGAAQKERERLLTELRPLVEEEMALQKIDGLLMDARSFQEVARLSLQIDKLRPNPIWPRLTEAEKDRAAPDLIKFVHSSTVQSYRR